MNSLDNEANQSSKFKTKSWVEMNYVSWEMYNKDDQIRFKISMIRSSLCNYGGAYILVKGTLIVRSTAAEDKQIMPPIKK